MKELLPESWAMGETKEGRLYYKDHARHCTSWEPPAADGCVAHTLTRVALLAASASLSA